MLVAEARAAFIVRSARQEKCGARPFIDRSRNDRSLKPSVHPDAQIDDSATVCTVNFPSVETRRRRRSERSPNCRLRYAARKRTLPHPAVGFTGGFEPVAALRCLEVLCRPRRQARSGRGLQHHRLYWFEKAPKPRRGEPIGPLAHGRPGGRLRQGLPASDSRQLRKLLAALRTILGQTGKEATISIRQQEPQSVRPWSLERLRGVQCHESRALGRGLGGRMRLTCRRRCLRGLNSSIGSVH